MSDKYQLRKDIDSLMRMVGQLNSNGSLDIEDMDLFEDNLSVLETNLTSFSDELDDYVESLESFENQLEEYGGSLEGFEGQLESYEGELGGFSTQLINYGGQLSGFSSQLGGFGDQLIAFQSTLGGYNTRLDDFDDALNDESTGFITTLSTLKTYIYGYDPNNPSAHSYSNPTSDSLKGMTNTLQQLVRDLQTGDGIVLENLGRLKSHIQAFSGSLQQFKAYLAQQGVDVSTLNDDVISLILELNKSLDVISDHQDMLEDAQEIIGEPSTQTTEATGFFKRFEEGDVIMEDLSDKADEVTVILEGDPTDPSDIGLIAMTTDVVGLVSGDPSDPSDTGLVGATSSLIETVNGDPTDPSDTGLVGATGELITQVGNSSSGLIKKTNDLIVTVDGDPTDPNDDGLIGKTDDLIETVKGDPTDPNDDGLIGKTDDLIETVGEPATGQQSATGLHLLIGNTQESAESIKEKIGYSAIGNVNLQSQITAQGGKIGNVPSGTNLQTQITAQNGEITGLQGDISDIQGDIGTVPTGKTLQGQITTIEDNAPIIVSDFHLNDDITDIYQRVNKSEWQVGDDVWIFLKLTKNNSSYNPSSTEFPIVIFTPSGQSSTIYRFRRIDNTEIYKYTISEKGFHILVFDGKTYPINVEDFEKYTLSVWDKQDYDSNFTTCDVTFSKQGHIVVCTYHINTVQFSNTSDHTLTTSIPSVYRPSSVFYQDITDYTNTTSNTIKNGLITIGTDGSMKIRMGTANTSMNVYGSFTYIVG